MNTGQRVTRENPAYLPSLIATDGARDAILEGERAFESGDFALAHVCFGKALEKTSLDSIKRRLLFDYLTSGYVALAALGDVDGLCRLVVRSDTDFDEFPDTSLDLLLVEIHQEIATRQPDNAMLLSNGVLLEELAEGLPEGHAGHANLTGLLCRRLAERDDYGLTERLALFAKACSLFEACCSGGQDGGLAEIRNNWGITLIRLFEATKDVAHLEAAERILSTIEFDAGSYALGDFLALPKALNNLGNISKQRLKHAPEEGLCASAVALYTKAEAYWGRETSPYEWAMLQKNRAETRLAHMDAFGYSARIAATALEEIEAALTHRTTEAAGYQFAKSVAVKQRIEALIASAAGD